MFNKKAFTLIELIISTVILWIWFIWVFITLKNSYKYLQNIRNVTLAINLAREWVEWVFSVRNSNWQRWAWKKDKCWLKINPLIDKDNDWCENDDWFQSWSYILYTTWQQKYFALKKTSPEFKEKWFIVNTDRTYLLCKNSNTNIVESCSNFSSRPSNYFDSTLFFRQVRWGYLLDKNSNTPLINCSKWTDSNCWTTSFKEKNFCVDVFYFDWSKKKVTFCSVMTNFKK